MSWTKETRESIKRLQYVERTLKDLFIDRDLVIELLVLAAVCQEHLLLLGPPGTAKTELVNRFTDLVQARRFHYLLTRFTEPSEVFGPLDLQEFQKGTYRIRTADMLPEAEVAFLDEIFQGSSAILNGFLALVNERVFYNGSERQIVPLICLVGASNLLPEDPVLRAFADRFALRVQVGPVAPDRIEVLVDRGWQLERSRIEATQQGRIRTADPAIEVADLKALHGRLREVGLKEIRPVYTQIIKEVRAQGVDVSDRRAIKGLKLVAGAALLRGTEHAGLQDLWPLNHIWSRPEEAHSLANIVQPRVAEGGGAVRDLSRPEAQIIEELAVLDEQAGSMRRETEVVAHLGRYNDLLNEARRDHQGNAALLERIQTSIEQLMGVLAYLESIHV
jgi:MoxR-like ATPase